LIGFDKVKATTAKAISSLQGHENTDRRRV
jgi:hypothetical protein